MLAEIDRQGVVDQEHLKLLALGYKISAAITALFSLMGLLYGAFGLFVFAMIAHAPKSSSAADQPPPAFVGWIFGTVGLAIFLAMIAVAALKLRTARCIEQQRSRVFCMVIAALSCLEFPYGTVLGIFTFIVLGRESVLRTFAVQAIAGEPTVQ